MYIVKYIIPPLFFLFFLAVLGIEPTALHMLGECPTIVPHPWPSFYLFIFFVLIQRSLAKYALCSLGSPWVYDPLASSFLVAAIARKGSWALPCMLSFRLVLVM